MLNANNASELLAALAELDITVPRRSDGRTKSHTERYAVAHLISALVEAEIIHYPMNISQRERPDFLLSMAEIQIGIEHTEAVPENEAHKTFLREKGGGSGVHYMSRNRPGEPKKQAKELIEEIERNDAGDGWGGDTVEREWAAAMFYFVEQKVRKLLSNGFERFEQDWLLIYDNWSLPALDRHEAAQFLLNIVNNSTALENFDYIFVLTGKYVCDISAEGLYFYSINDVWN